MSKFLSEAHLEPMWTSTGLPLYSRGGRRMYKVILFPTYQSDVAKQTFQGSVGFVTDLGSVPRIPLVYDAIGDIAIEPYIIHDLLYSLQLVSRKMADDVLLEALEVVGISKWKRYQIYLGVRIGGSSSYNLDILPALKSGDSYGVTR